MHHPSPTAPMRHTVAFISSLFCLLLLTSCGGEALGTGMCASSSDCETGERCIDGRCEAVDPTPDSGRALDSGSTPRDSAMPDASCVMIEGATERIERPVDIIVMVDSTPTMGPAVDRIEAVINDDFTTVVAASGVDYRVILLAQDVTIGPPLSTSSNFNRLNIELGSGTELAFKPTLDNFATWSAWLRPEAIKVFLHFTDSEDRDGGRNITGYAGTFDEELVRLSPTLFGTAGDLNFIYHAIIGVRANTPVTVPYLPPTDCDAGDPVVTDACSHPSFSGSPGPGPGFQELAIRTGGLRFPVCEFANFNVVFQQIAADVIEVSSAPCTFLLPDPPAGEVLDPATLVLRYSATGGEPWQTFRRVTNPADCTAESFTLTSDQIELCPAACAAVRCSPDAVLRAVAGCHPFLM